MAFSAAEIEDGTGKPGALVYGTTDPVQEAVDYLLRRGFSALNGLAGETENGVDKQETALLRGTEYVEQLTTGRVLGRKRVSTQALHMPRVNLVPQDGQTTIPSDTVPPKWLGACYVASELYAAGETLFDVADDQLHVIRDKTSTALETEWSPHGPTNLKRYHQVEVLVEPFLEGALEIQRG